jgi:hypothetical protein
MRSSFGPERFLLASKKPYIKQLLANVNNLSEDDIKKLNEKPDIIKGLLAIKKTHGQAEAAIRAEIIANQMIEKSLKTSSKN